ncbi:MAG TPA: serine/threonine-protein kinase [Polyangiaceae bacterium]|nr:serine/threonine-protein kinase [Polyangiaceae bacterium]
MPGPEQPIALLGRYALFDEIARGGMATVHLARLRGPVGFSKTVAIKRMHEQVARDRHFVKMFLDEARVAGRIQHPNVVTVFDVIADAGEAYLVMEYIDGAPLSTLVKSADHAGQDSLAPVDPKFAVHILRDALYGLHAAHEATDERGLPLQLVHRDVSPQNILVGVDGVARVLDFGIAKAVGRLQDTDSGQIKGKVAYMAPEQLTGRAVDRRADVFAAGVVLWEALAGRRLFAASSSAETMYRVLEDAVPKLDEVVADLPKALVDAVSTATAKEPAQRFPTALDFARELEQSVTLVPNHVVGQWVRDTAGPSLEAKRARVRAIEAFELPADGAPLVLPPARAAAPAAPYVRASPDEVTRAENPVTIATQADRVQRPVLAISAVLIVAVLGGLWLRGRGADVHTDGTAEAASAAPSTAEARPSVEAPPPSVPAPAAPLVPAGAVEARPAAAAPSATSAPKATSSKRLASPRPRSTPPRKPESLFSRE